MTPLVSIIMPLYNRADYIRETLDSLIRQTYQSWECIVVDDHSTDDSFNIAEQYSLEEKRIKVFRRSGVRKGAPVCRNEGMQKAAGKYLMFLDSDDLLGTDCLQERTAVMELQEDLDFCVNHVSTFLEQPGDNTRNWSNLSYADDVAAFLRGEGWQTSSTFFRASFAKQFSWSEEACSWQDWEFHLSILMESPRYQKRSESKADVFIRRGNMNRISSTNRSFVRIECLFKLFIVVQERLTQKGYGSYGRLMTGNWFVFMEIAAIQLSTSNYLNLKKMWATPHVKSSVWKPILSLYFSIQNMFSRNKLRYGNAFAYRMARLILPHYVTKSSARVH